MADDLATGSSAEEDSSEESSSEAEDHSKQLQEAVEEQQQQVESDSSSSASSSSSSDEGAGGDHEERAADSQDSQFPNTQQLFGGDSSESDSSDNKSGGGSPLAPVLSPGGLSPAEENGQSRTVEGLFGDTAELSSSEDEAMSTGEHDVDREKEEPGEESSFAVSNREGISEEEVPRINVEIPRCVANLGSDIHFVKLPNFLSVETRPFDTDLYEDEGDEDEILDEEGRARLKLKVENTIRWRYSQDESGNDIRESNARLVKWSDGSMSLYLGSEIFDIHRQPLQGEFSHLFVRQGTGLQGQAVFKSKLTFRPHSTDSQTHRKMTLSIADRFSKAQKIRVLPAVGKDPESQRLERIKREEENLKAAIRREHHKRRLREKHLRGGLSASYLEPDRELESEEDLSAIKSTVRSHLTKRRGQSESSDSESEEGEGAERLLKAKVDEREDTKRLPRRSRKLDLSDDEDGDSSSD